MTTDSSVNSKPLLISFAVLLLLQAALFYQSYGAMMHIWWRSETFAHGFLIFPITLYLVWRQADSLAKIPLQPDLRALPLLLGLAALWVVAHRVDVAVVEQYATVGMIPLLTWLILGWSLVRALAFPLLFLLLAVPMGEFLIMPMMDFTAAFTVSAVRLSGIPVFRDGMFFSLPSGEWSVVEGCSGVRYIIASVTLGMLYAYLTYVSYWRRAAFMVLAVAFPIIANGLRAYMIVMIAHFSNMKLATGVDHIIYGWVWFGLVMLMMFWLGSLWRDDDVEPDADQSEVTAPQTQAKTRWYTATASAGLVLILGPLWSGWITAQAAADTFKLVKPATSVWQQVEPLTDWQPRYLNPSAEVMQSYQLNDQQVGIYLAHYGQTQSSDSGVKGELVNSQNVLVVQKHPVWQWPTQQPRTVMIQGRDYPLLESRLRSAKQELLVWHWQRVAGLDTVNPLRAKFQEALTELRGGSQHGFGIMVYTPIEGDVDEARAQLQQFVDDEWAAIEPIITP